MPKLHATRNRSASAALAATLILFATAASAAADFTFTPDITGGFGRYKWSVSIEGAAATGNPSLTLLRGTTYALFANNSSIHPFWIKTVPSILSANAYTGAELTGTNGTIAPATLTFTPDASTPDTLYYDCGNHMEMVGTIHIITNAIFADGFESSPIKPAG